VLNLPKKKLAHQQSRMPSQVHNLSEEYFSKILIMLVIVPNGNCSHSSPPEKPARKRKDGGKGGDGKSKENKAKRRKRVRDAAAPKHPLSGYVRFMNDHRDRIKAENPKSNFTIVTKILAGEWSKLASPEKQVNKIYSVHIYSC